MSKHLPLVSMNDGLRAAGLLLSWYTTEPHAVLRSHRLWDSDVQNGQRQFVKMLNAVKLLHQHIIHNYRLHITCSILDNYMYVYAYRVGSLAALAELRRKSHIEPLTLKNREIGFGSLNLPRETTDRDIFKK